MEFNHHSATNIYGNFFSPLRVEQFQRAISAGIISILAEELKVSLLSAYTRIGKANNAIEMYAKNGSSDGGMLIQLARAEVSNSASSILEAKDKLQEFLHSDT